MEEKGEESLVTAMGKRLKSTCQVKTDKITDHSFKFVNNFEIYSRSTISDMTLVFNGRTLGYLQMCAMDSD